MKISVDMDYTTKLQAENVKYDIKEFRHSFDDTDVIHMACSAAHVPYRGQEAVLLQGEAFPGGYYYQNETHFHFRVVLLDYHNVHDISFYCDRVGTIFEKTSAGDPMVRRRTYTFESE